MKKIILLFAFSMLFSCSNSDDNPVNQNNIAGTYKLTEYIQGSGIPVDLNKDGVLNSNIVRETSCFNNNLMIFQSGGTYTSSSTSSSIVINTAGAVESITCGSTTNETGTWSENATTVFIINVTTGGETFLKEGNNLRFTKNYTTSGSTNFNTTMLYTKQ